MLCTSVNIFWDWFCKEISHSSCMDLPLQFQHLLSLPPYLQVFREYYPIKDQPSVLLECRWQTDKYVLVEKINENQNHSQRADIGEAVPLGASAVQYKSIEVLLGGNNIFGLSLHVPLFNLTD